MTNSPSAELRAAATKLRDVAPTLTGPLAGLADPIADWLDAEATGPLVDLHSDRCAERGCTILAALAVARAVNGGES